MRERNSNTSLTNCRSNSLDGAQSEAWKSLSGTASTNLLSAVDNEKIVTARTATVIDEAVVVRDAKIHGVFGSQFV